MQVDGVSAVATTNTANIATNVTNIATNATAIATNVNSITSLQTNVNNLGTAVGSNSAAIGVNAGKIANNSALIGVNAAAIGVNDSRISELRSGMAALASVPDLYLTNDETWTVAGGISMYDDGYGGAETGFGGGVQFRSSTSDNWSVGAAGSVAGGAYSLRVQARIGG